VAHARGDGEQALALLEESLMLSREVTDTRGVALALASLGSILNQRNDPARAAELLWESLGLHRGLGDRWGIAQCLDELAGAMMQGQQWRSAALLLGAAERIQAQLGAAPLAPARARRDRWLPSLRARLGESDLRAALEEGRSLQPEQVVERALGQVGDVERAASPLGGLPGAADGYGLTPREREVIEVVAEGATDREVAARLVIAERTVKTHLQSVFRKLGARNRTEAVARYREHQG
jgi:DNA-binding CsgD family transcriptional regulator